MTDTKVTCDHLLKQALRRESPACGAAAFLLCVTAGCVEADIRTSVTEEALSSPIIFSVSGAVSFDPEDPAMAPMAAVADFNNDGDPDVAIENHRSAVIVRLGDGAGSFGPERVIGLGNTNADRPSFVIAKDLDADGKVDIVTANDASLKVLRGNGDGTFGAPTSLAILQSFFQPGLGSVTAGDLDGDGKLDLAASSNGGVGVFLGNGDGTFGARTDLLCNGNIHHNSVTALDFNGDGKLDLASAGSFTSEVHLFRGNGNGTFATCTSITVGTTTVPFPGEPTRPQSMTTGDFNHDGKPDLATANSWGTGITVLLNQPGGTFTTRDIGFKGNEFDMLFVGAAEVDGDGSLDLLVGHQSSLFVLTGSPDGTFETTSIIPFDQPARFAVAGRFDRDPAPRTDLLVSTDAGEVALLRGDGGSVRCSNSCTPFIVDSTAATDSRAAPGATGGLNLTTSTRIQDGDVMYAFLTKTDDAGAIVTPAGWTQLDQLITTDGDDFTSGVWRRVVTSAGTEPPSVRFTHTDSTAEAMTGYVVIVRGANTVTPEDAPVVRASGLNNTHPSSPSVTTTSRFALVLFHQGVTGSAMDVVEPFGTTLLQSTEAANRNSGVVVLSKATPGATGARQWLNNFGSSGADFHTRSVAVRPL